MMSSVSLGDAVKPPFIIGVMAKGKKRTKPLALGPEFPKRLKELRERAQLSQEALGKALGYETGQTVSNWERGENEPTPGTWPLLVQVLGCTAEELLGQATRAFGGFVNQIVTNSSQPESAGSQGAGRDENMLAIAIIKLQQELEDIRHRLDRVESGEPPHGGVPRRPQRARRTS